MVFDRYRVPKSVSEGVMLTLPKEPDVSFLVALPSEFNREFLAAAQRAFLASGRSGSGDNPGAEVTEADVLEFRAMQIDAFLEHCILKMPEGLTKQDLRDNCWRGLEDLFKVASDMAEDEARAGERATKKSRA